MTTVFLLSPARCGGDRAAMLAASRTAALGAQLRGDGAAIGDVFAWLSALYFRGKLTYARRFAPETAGVDGVLVMAPGLGLCPPDTAITARRLAAMGKVAIESPAFARPLRRDAVALADRLAAAAADTARVVLLGSIATGKYVDTLIDVFGRRLVFPAAFVGRGDMSRGGLLLRASRSGDELDYIPVDGAVRHGRRPPKLPAVTRSEPPPPRRSRTATRPP
jgi:hypothetical protein